MFSLFTKSLILLVFTLVALPVWARCAVCYTKGLSGASIAVIVIITSAILLFIANKFLHKFLNKKEI